MNYHKHEELVEALTDPETLETFVSAYANFPVGRIPKMLGDLLVWSGNLVFGSEPSYGKFKAIEVIARIPYQSWEVMSYMLLTMFYANEARAIALSRTSRFSRMAQDNETMHVVLLSQLAKKHGQNSFFKHTVIPLIFAFFYFFVACILYLFSPRSALELNYVFESHAFIQYDAFVKMYAEDMKTMPVLSDFLEFYGRHAKNEYELFVAIRADEIIHRNASAHRVEEYRQGTSQEA